MSDPKIKKVVYFVRHGQSEHNIAPVFQSPDSPLNELGCKQAASIAERVSKLSFEALITSPFARAKQTADIIAKATGKEYELSDLFVERVKPTVVNGKSYEDKEANDIWRKWEESLYKTGIRVADGENFDDLITRADKALKFLEDRPEQSLVVVTHGFFLRTLIARILIGDLLSGEAFFRFQKSASMENTGISVIRYQTSFEQADSWRLWIYNDHAHLG